VNTSTKIADQRAPAGMKKPPGGEPDGWSLLGAGLVRSLGWKFERVVVCPEALGHGVELVDREQEKILVIE
jgi:hypothetical protein